MNMEVIRNPETEELELKNPLSAETLNNINFLAQELKKARHEQLITESIYKREAKKGAELKLLIEFLQIKILDILPLNDIFQDKDVYVTVKEYPDFEITDENLIPEDFIVKRNISQINKMLIKEQLNNKDIKIPGVRRCKKLKVIIK